MSIDPEDQFKNWGDVPNPPFPHKAGDTQAGDSKR